MVTTGKARIMREGHRSFITPSRARVSVSTAVSPRRSVTLAERLGGKPYFWLGALADDRMYDNQYHWELGEDNLSSAADYMEV